MIARSSPFLSILTPNSLQRPLSDPPVRVPQAPPVRLFSCPCLTSGAWTESSVFRPLAKHPFPSVFSSSNPLGSVALELLESHASSPILLFELR